MKTLLLILGCLNCCHLLSANPCVNHTVLDQPWRSTKCANTDCSSLKCDEDLATGWYRFNGSGGSTIPDKLVPRNLCSTHAPGWLNGTHPIPDDGEVTRKVCFHWRENPCLWSVEIKIKQCSNYFVYYLVKTPFCSLAYCTGEAVVPTPPTKPETTLPPTPETTLPPKPETTLPPTPETTLPPTPETTLPPTPETTLPPTPETTLPPKPETTPPPKLETTLPPKPETTPPQVASSMIVPNPTSPSSGMGGKQFQLVITLLGDCDPESMQKVMLEVQLLFGKRLPDLKLQLSLGKY